MKELNRRAFLTLSGASVALLALAACGSTPSTPAVPTTGEAAKVLEAINLYRKKAGVNEPLVLDDGLKPAAEIVVKLATDKTQNPEESTLEYGKIMTGYTGPCQPIGLIVNTNTAEYFPKYACMDSAEQMAEYLWGQIDDTALNQLKLPNIKLAYIQTFQYGGLTYWVAVAAEGKKLTP